MMVNSSKQYDLVIVGGGLVGSSLLAALRDSGLNIAIIEANQHKTSESRILDQRSLVLSLASKLFYEQIGVWEHIVGYATEIRTIKISEQGTFSKLFLDSETLGVNALGYVINIDILNQAVWGLVNNHKNKLDESNANTNIDVLCPVKLLSIENNAGIAGDTENTLLNLVDKNENQFKIATKILIAADGGRSYVRELLNVPYDKYDYEQLALIANVEHELENHHIAYERFSKQGPFAILPRSDKNISGIVWPWPKDQQDYLKNLSDSELLLQLQKLFGYKLGRFKRVGARQYFPLMRINTKQLSINRVLFLGNSANNIHPIGGQGFNLGLRDIKHFTAVLQQEKIELIKHDFAQDYVNKLFRQYSELRLDDHANLINGTHSILGLFASDKSLVKLSRNLGMTLVNHSYILRTLIADHSMGLRAA